MRKPPTIIALHLHGHEHYHNAHMQSVFWPVLECFDVHTLNGPAVASSLMRMPYYPQSPHHACSKKNKFEKVKVEKCGSTSWTEVHELAAKLRCAQGFQVHAPPQLVGN